MIKYTTVKLSQGTFERSRLGQSKHVHIKHVRLISLTDSNFDPLVNTPHNRETDRDGETD